MTLASLADSRPDYTSPAMSAIAADLLSKTLASQATETGRLVSQLGRKGWLSVETAKGCDGYRMGVLKIQDSSLHEAVRNAIGYTD